MKNCVDIIRPLTEAVETEITTPIQIVGGNGAAALVNPNTAIVTSERRLVAPIDLDLPQYREDGNKRDLDILVVTTDPEAILKVEQLAGSIIGDELELSFFGLIPMAQLEAQRRKPLSNALWRVMADRYAEESDGQIMQANKAVFPFAVKMDLDFLQTWQLFIGDKDPNPSPIPHPGATILNYLTRSISGLRPKDANKISQLTGNILSKVPEIRDWIMDGPGQSQVELARILHTLRQTPRNLGCLSLAESLTITPYKDELEEHEAFMIPDESKLIKGLVLAMTQAKSRGLYTFESNPAIVTLWQRYAERHAGKFVKNQ